MTEIQIEKGVPVPEPKNARKYPLAEMAVGDSFFVPNTAPVCIYPHLKRFRSETPGVSFTCRHRMESGKLGTRVWRKT
jgi:hypothetical protein